MKEIGNGRVEGSVQELLGLSDAEAAYVETKAALTRAVRERRLALGLSSRRPAWPRRWGPVIWRKRLLL